MNPTINHAAPAIPDYILMRRIGKGAYGEVWLALGATGDFRAVKIVQREGFAEARPFDREFEGIKNFEPVSHGHPGLVDILMVGKSDPHRYFYYVMEVADDLHSGCRIDPERYQPKTLAAVMYHGHRPPFEDCLQIALSLTAGLGHLHQQGLIHRDIKPSNIIFVNGMPKLADVGLVTVARDCATVVGSPGYMPPEGPGRPVGDIYSLGILLYELFTGKSCLDFPELPGAFQQGNASPRLMQVSRVILKACAFAPHKRCQSTEELFLELSALLP